MNYKIIECNDTDSVETIKKNYRRLILKYHPDKNHGNSEKFIEISKAYTQIINRKKFNNDLNDKAKHYLFLLYLCMKPKDIVLNLSINVIDIYSGNIKKINYSRYFKGKKIKDHVFVDLKNFKESYVLHGYGDENPFTHKSGDLNINFSIDYGSFYNVYINNIIDIYDMSYKIKITLYEFFFGITNTYPFIDRQVDISFHKPHRDGLMLTLPSFGLPYENEDEQVLRGNLVILLEIDLSRIRTDTIEKDEEFELLMSKYFYTLSESL